MKRITRVLIISSVLTAQYVFYRPPVSSAEQPIQMKVISVDMDKQPFDHFLTVIAEVSQYNIIALDVAPHDVTAKFDEVMWSKALDSVLESEGMSKLIDGNVIRVFKRERLQRLSRRPPGFYIGRPISLDLQDTDLENAMRIIEEVSNKKITRRDEDIKDKKLTLRLIDVPWDQCLEIIAEVVGMKIEKDGNIYAINPGC